MNLSSIEITENEYLIKLSKEDFDLSFINQLLKRIQAEKFFTRNHASSEEEDIISKVSKAERSSYFDHLDDK
ncbi:hypothetical protein [Pararcticibacter amylolyticus]|uniref:Uncharacterized protein n=1 Tax=Pararcticibacter amylolyticus TaxID=2173175 RepID=A0A2U2PD63_9SPHI|nr:hypothetical protein [Pararcticibacter amylolyticus]PWG79341.1 hypothetical protein DDR33_17650 [Pararcticibacter amylolyticus]